jgi:serine/threonine protein kinase
MTYQTQRKKHETYPWETLEQRFNEKGLPRDVLGFVRENGVPDNLVTEACRLLMGIRFDSTHGEIETKNGIDQFDILAEIVPHETQRPYAIYKVQDQKTQSIYVMKISKPDSSDDDRDRLAKEAKFYRDIYSENVCRCFSHNYSFRDGKKAEFFLLMEYVDGKPLSAFIERKRQLTHDRIAEVLKIAKGIAKGLSAAHKQDKIHRDIKPANVVLTEKKVPKLIDFGIATRYSTNQPAAGTPGYLSPEQSRNQPVTKQTDIFSFGIILWEMLSGDKLFPVHDRDTYFESIRCWSGCPPPETCISGVHENIAELLTFCLSADPAARPSADSIVKTIAQHLKVYHSNDLDKLCNYRDQSKDIVNNSHIEFRELSEVVDDWITNDLPGRLLTITGVTGDGKSTFVCKWATQKMSQFPIMLWLCSNDTNRAIETTCDPTGFVAEFIRFLKTNISGFDCDVTIDTALLKTSPIKALERYCLGPLSILDETAQAVPCIMMLDNVQADGGASFEHREAMSDVVAVLDQKLPKYFKIIQTYTAIECSDDSNHLDLNKHQQNLQLSFAQKAALDIGQWFLNTSSTFRGLIDQQIGRPHALAALGDEIRLNELRKLVFLRKLNPTSMSDWCQRLLDGTLEKPFQWQPYVAKDGPERFWKYIRTVSPEAMDYSDLFCVLNVLEQPIPLPMLKEILPVWPGPFENIFHFFNVSQTHAVEWNKACKAVAMKPNRVYVPGASTGHKILAEACKKVLDNPYAVSEECLEFAFNNYGLHLLGAGMMANYEIWLLSSQRKDFFKTRPSDSCYTITKEYSLLDRERRSGFVLQNKMIFDLYLEAGIHSQVEHWTHMFRRDGGISADLSDVIRQIVTEAVEFQSSDTGKLLVFGSHHSGDINGVGDDTEVFLQDIWNHPLWKDLEKSRSDQGNRMVKVYAEIFRHVTGNHSDILSKPMNAMRADGRLGGFFHFLEKEVRMTFSDWKHLGWVQGKWHSYYNSLSQSFLENNETLDLQEIAIIEENLVHSTVEQLLTVLFILSRGWVPKEAELEDWLDGCWVINGLPHLRSPERCVRIIEESGEQEAVDEFKSAFRQRHLTDEVELGWPLKGRDPRPE